MHSEGEVVWIVATGTPNCQLGILDFYLSKVPLNVVKEGGKFHLSPLPFTPSSVRPWFFTDPQPQKKIQGLRKKMCQEAKLLPTTASEQQEPQFFSMQVFQRTSSKRGQATSHWRIYIPVFNAFDHNLATFHDGMVFWSLYKLSYFAPSVGLCFSFDHSWTSNSCFQITFLQLSMLVRCFGLHINLCLTSNKLVAMPRWHM